MNANASIFLASLAFVVPYGPLIANSASDAHGKIGVGILEVFTGTKTYNSGDILYFPHTSYAIYHANGNFYRFVKNHTTPTDELPFVIPIPAGHYFILAQSEMAGPVKIPITIRSGRIATIRLDAPNRKKIPRDSQLIRLESGSAVGWSWSRRAPSRLLERHSMVDLFGLRI